MGINCHDYAFIDKRDSSHPSDGNRQGFPFDPYHLYFHRRVVIVYGASQRLLSNEAAKNNLPKAFFTFSSKLENYLSDPVIIEATELYEKAFDIFEGIRGALRIGAKGQARCANYMNYLLRNKML